jgi:hypothetical protein
VEKGVEVSPLRNIKKIHENLRIYHTVSTGTIEVFLLHTYLHYAALNVQLKVGKCSSGEILTILIDVGINYMGTRLQCKQVTDFPVHSDKVH